MRNDAARDLVCNEAVLSWAPPSFLSSCWKPRDQTPIRQERLAAVFKRTKYMPIPAICWLQRTCLFQPKGVSMETSETPLDPPLLWWMHATHSCRSNMNNIPYFPHLHFLDFTLTWCSSSILDNNSPVTALVQVAQFFQKLKFICMCILHINLVCLFNTGHLLASYSGLHMFNWKHVIDFHDIMDVVYNDVHW